MTELQEDTAQRVKEQSDRLVTPNEHAPEGYVLTVVGTNPFQYAWRQPPHKQVLEGSGNPNTAEINAPNGTLYVKRGNPSSLWENDDGRHLWHELGSGSSTDPDSFDYLEAQDHGATTSIASGTQTKFGFDDAGNTSGTDIFINGSNELRVNADGIYAFSCVIHMQSNANNDTFDQVLGFVHIERSVRGDVNLRDYRTPVVISGPKHYAQMAFSWTGFMTAADEFQVHGNMFDGGADTWTGDAYAFVQRIV